jgi:ribonuclease J
MPGSVPRQNLMLIVTGSQGERRAASAQLSRGKYLGIEMKEGDTFLFSSKTIPGNERGVLRIVNAFSEMGVDVVDDDGGLYHVSGHANRPDLETLHRLVLPADPDPDARRTPPPARTCQARRAAGHGGRDRPNGMMLDLTGEEPEVAEYIETGRTYLDGSVLIGALDGVVRDRIRMALNGHVIVTLILDEDDAPWASLGGTDGPAGNGKGGRRWPR